MPFPLSYSKTLKLNKDRYQKNLDELLRNLLIGLQKEEASMVDRKGNSLFFRGGFRFVNSFNILLPVSSGTITAEEVNNEVHIDFKLRFTQLLLITTVIPMFFGTILMLKTELNLIQIASFLIFAWLWLFGINYMSTIIRFPRFIRKSIN